MPQVTQQCEAKIDGKKLQGKKLRAQCTDPIKRTFAEHLEKERAREREVGR